MCICCAYVCTCVRVCVHLCIWLYACVHSGHLCIYLNMCMCVCICVYVHIRLHFEVRSVIGRASPHKTDSTPLYLHTSTHTPRQTITPTHIHTCALTRPETKDHRYAKLWKHRNLGQTRTGSSHDSRTNCDPDRHYPESTSCCVGIFLNHES